ncbi:hypothetical protein PV396_31000 [Streptomyces sp. ME02-8801-2C]|uniref:hypothetical protein n=1 Tax=Streptomyces sp. ME02-8801-2C TaxID=3028680 RepID=UPI0029A7751B|nr:hypothetical protein [Streptomyces sp. ME02-8801-2C]MDX3456319.1 hypothetical protein [Streptomyces sp. ME02-8801-2C]
MGSMRNPVGPLPSSIYWRRRAVLLSALALLTLLGIWLVASGGGGGDHRTDGANGKAPVQTITPGPSGSGPAISQAPGGRDESSGSGGSGGSDSGGSGSGSGSGSGGSAGPGDSGGAGGSDSGGSGGGSAGTGAGGAGTDDGVNGSVGSGDTLPAGSTLPNCTAGVVQLSLRSVQNAYAPDETPTFQLVAKNSSANDCKIDLGPKSAVVTITQTSSDDDIWSSDDCPKDAAGLLFRVSAGDSITYTFEWDRRASAPECATPKAGPATADTYLVEAQAPGFPKAQTSFVLDKD